MKLKRRLNIVPDIKATQILLQLNIWCRCQQRWQVTMARLWACQEREYSSMYSTCNSLCSHVHCAHAYTPIRMCVYCVLSNKKPSCR